MFASESTKGSFKADRHAGPGQHNGGQLGTANSRGARIGSDIILLKERFIDMREILCTAMVVCIFSTTLISQARNTPAQPSAQPTARSPVTPTPPVIDTDYVIGEEDTVEVRVWKEPDF